MKLEKKVKILLGAFIISNIISPIMDYPITKASNDSKSIIIKTSDDDAGTVEIPTTAIRRPATTTLIPISPREFFTAVQHNDKQAIRYLLSHSLDIDTQNPMGWTALHYATFLGNLDMVKFLVDKCNATINLRDKRGLTPYDIAWKNHKKRIAKFLLKKYNSHSRPI